MHKVFGLMKLIELDEFTDDDDQMHIYVDEDGQDYITKEDAIAIIKHLHEVFDIK